jgi:hypothetical protein
MRLLPALCLLLCFTPVAGAATYLVRPDGSGLVGALPVGCGVIAATPTTWGAIRASFRRSSP